ncbi:Mitochondrial import receptor subunit TOM9-2 [Ananas comosus]|uniref:Mitochondrial import receptor subunit TOM9-2 n=1 Tax=Ananas comosus TaxID=4615 RepID=A0A199UW59_ANACO|nr:Mitochondrial import receptor subunit TOM9-2 [Ananas comosus]
MSSSLSRRGRGEGVLGSISRSPIVVRGREAAAEAATVAKKLLRSTGKAAWIAGTTFLVLFVPLIIEMDREQQLNELELQQATLLGGPSPALPPPPPSKKRDWRGRWRSRGSDSNISLKEKENDSLACMFCFLTL